MAEFSIPEYGYTLRSSRLEDKALAADFEQRSGFAGMWRGFVPGEFWVKQTDLVESFIVLERRLVLAFYQIEHVGKRLGVYTEQARLHFQYNPQAPTKRILRGITRLVPLIEKGLASRGTQAIFFTSHSPMMARFMELRMGYRPSGSSADGTIMAKGLKR